MAREYKPGDVVPRPEHADMPDGVGNQWPAIPDVPAL